MDLIKEKFPLFKSYWEAYIRDFGADLSMQMIPFEDYALDRIKENNEVEIKKIFDFVEYLLANGDDYVQTAITTEFLEYLMSKDPDEIKFAKFVKYIGRNAIDYCKAWDEFNGVRTEGLWDKE